jgi:hypothetical protein
MREEFVGHLEALAAKLEYVGGDDTARFSAAYRRAGRGAVGLRKPLILLRGGLNRGRKGSMVGSHDRGPQTPKAKAAAGAGGTFPLFTRVPAWPCPTTPPPAGTSLRSWSG